MLKHFECFPFSCLVLHAMDHEIWDDHMTLICNGVVVRGTHEGVHIILCVCVCVQVCACVHMTIAIWYLAESFDLV